MHCQHCQYPLWHLSARRCPECATVFSLRDFHFRKCSITIRCPHCAFDCPAPVTTGDLNAAQFTCPNCSKAFDHDTASFGPVEGAPAPVPRDGELPWLRSGQRLGGWWATICMSFKRPDLLTLGGLRHGTPLAATGFFAINVLVTTLPVVLSVAILGGGPAETFKILIFIVGVLAVLPLVWAAIVHAGLGASANQRGFAATRTAFAYTSGCLFFLWIPCLGLLITPLIWASLASVGLSAAHRISDGRALLVTFGVPVVITILIALVAQV